MYPSIGVGGYCLTKDALLASWARQNLIGENRPLSQSQRAISINDQMPHYAFEYLQRQYPDLNGSNILLLGISYRGDVADTRSSPVEKLYEYLDSTRCIISCHDPYVKYWNEKEMEIEQNLDYHLRNSPDIIIIATGHSIYKSQDTISSILDLEPVLIFDTIGLLTNAQISFLQERHKVKVLGRGDL